jgi:hypothetical protein
MSSQNNCENTNSNKQIRMNNMLYDRNVPSSVLQPYLDVRPVSTKYSYLPIVDPRKIVKTNLQIAPLYNTNEIFNPGTRKSPWSGYASNVNLESELRNQVFALQKCSQSVYVPQQRSDLYDYKFRARSENMTHTLLFNEEQFQRFNPNPDNSIIGTNIFNNSTRTQIKDLTVQLC